MTIDIDSVLDPLREIESRGFGRYNLYRDWVELMLYSLQREDDPYLDILDDYDHGNDYDQGDRPADLFAEAFGELLSAIEESNRDVLGMTYEEFGMGNDAFGQHFTPHRVGAWMAEMQTPSGDLEPPITIADPACGSGRMLVLAARQHDVETICFGQDKDLLCAEIAALNLCFFNLNGVIVYGDSLTLEKRRAWRTRNTIMGGEVAEVSPEDVAWPESSLTSGSPAPAASENEGEEAAEAGERVDIEADGGTLDQSELGPWLE